jgi:predicted nucleic acid-binding protein
MRYLIDACSLIAVFNGEPGADIVLGLLDKARAGVVSLYMSIIQLLEVYYDRLYISGEYGARIRIESILDEPVSIIESITYPVMYEAGRFKTSYSMSLADAFLCATAKSISATLVTKDNEMRAAEEAGEFSVLWIK